MRRWRIALPLLVLVLLLPCAHAQGIVDGTVEGGAAGGPVGAIIVFLAEMLELLFGGGGAVQAALQQLANSINQSAQMLLGVVDTLYEYLLTILHKIVAALVWLWQEFFLKLLQKLVAALRAAVLWIESILKPIVQYLKQVRDYLVRYYNTFLKPLLTLIQRVRQYLVILSFLHIHIAQQLDQFLAQLQAKIVTSFATVVATINTLIDITNALVDPRYLIRHPALLISIRRQVPALLHALTGRPPGYWFPSPRGSAGGPFAPVLPFFDFTNPAQNPPTSSYVTEDDGVPDLSGYMDGFQFTNGAVDQVAMLDYFNDDLYSPPVCTNPAQCLATALTLASQAPS